MTMKPQVAVRVTRHFDAPPERVFDAWINPARIGEWMFGPRLREEEVLRISVDARVGGSFSFLVRRQGVEFDHVGTYHEIDRPRRLVFSWGVAGSSDEESRVVIDIVRADTGSELTLTHEMRPKWEEFASRAEDGWTKMLDTLAAVLG